MGSKNDKPEDVGGRSFPMDKQEDVQSFRSKILKILEVHASNHDANPLRMKFLLSVINVPGIVFHWTRTVYGEHSELKPHNAPETLSNFVTFTHYVNVNLMQDVTTGRSVAGKLHMINKTPIEWYSRKQATTEMPIYGSEFVIARICVEQIVDLVPLRDKS